MSKTIWEIKFDEYIDIKKFFITTGDMNTKLERVEQDIYKLLQDMFDIGNELKQVKEEDDVTYLETFVEDGKIYIKAKKSRARRIVEKEDDQEQT